MNTAILEVITCPMSGELGLIVKGMPTNEETSAATDGRLIAHDLIEHVNGINSIGSVGDELEALGAVWFTRGHLSDISRGRHAGYHTPEAELSSDVLSMYMYWQSYGWGEPVPEVAAVYNLEDAMREIMRQGIRLIRGEIDDFRQQRDGIAEFIREARHFMRAGYKAQAEKYGDDEYRANNVFWNIAGAVDEVCASVEFVGQEFELVYDESGARCSEYCDEDDERGCDECGGWFTPADDDDSLENGQGFVMCGDCVRAEQEAETLGEVAA